MNQSIIDVNVNLSRWPTRRLPGDDVHSLKALLKSQGVQQAWASSFDGLLHKDIAAVNERLVADCRAGDDVQLLPVGSINPTLPDWQEDVRRCHRKHRMRAVRVHPNYHGYALDHPGFAALLKMAEDLNLVVMLPVQMEDERVMHPLLRVKPVDIEPLKVLLPQVPRLRIVVLNAGKALLGKIAMLASSSQVYMDIATLDGLAVIEEVIRNLPLERVLFGSHAPLFYFESAVLKLKEAELSRQAFQAICFDNARSLIPAIGKE